MQAHAAGVGRQRASEKTEQQKPGAACHTRARASQGTQAIVIWPGRRRIEAAAHHCAVTPTHGLASALASALRTPRDDGPPRSTRTTRRPTLSLCSSPNRRAARDRVQAYASGRALASANTGVGRQARTGGDPWRRDELSEPRLRGWSDAALASRLWSRRTDALDARCTEMKSMMVKLVENQPTKTCLDGKQLERPRHAQKLRQASSKARGRRLLTAEEEKFVRSGTALSPKKQPHRGKCVDACLRKTVQDRAALNI